MQNLRGGGGGGGANKVYYGQLENREEREPFLVKPLYTITLHTYIHTLLTFPLEAFQRQYNNNLKLLKNSKIIFRLKIN